MKQFILALQLISNCIMAQDSLNNLSGMLGVPFGANKATALTIINLRYPDADMDTSRSSCIYLSHVRWGDSNDDNISFNFNADGEFSDGAVIHDVDMENEIFTKFRDLVTAFNTKYHYRDYYYEAWEYPYDKSDENKHGVTAVKLNKAKFCATYLWDVADIEKQDSGRMIQISFMTDARIGITYRDLSLWQKRRKVIESKKASDY